MAIWIDKWESSCRRGPGASYNPVEVCYTYNHAILTLCYPVLLKLLAWFSDSACTVPFQRQSAFHTITRRSRLGGKMETEIDRHSFGRLHLSSLPWIFISFDPSLKISIFIISESSLWFLYTFGHLLMLSLTWILNSFSWVFSSGSEFSPFGGEKGWFDKVGYWTGFWDNYLPVKHHHLPTAAPHTKNFFFTILVL